MRFDPEQEELRRTVRTLLERAAGGDVWRLLAEQVGALGLAVPEEFGGAGFSVLETHVVLEELGAALAAPGFLSTTLAAQAILAGDSVRAKGDLLPGIAAGETRATVGWGGAVEASSEGGGWRLTGVDEHVLDGGEADLLVVPALIADRSGLMQEARPGLAQAAPPGLTQEARPGLAQAARPGLTHEARPDLAQAARPGLTHEARPGLAQAARPGLTHEARPDLAQATPPGLTQEARPDLPQEAPPGLAREARPDLPQEAPRGLAQEARRSLARGSQPAPGVGLFAVAASDAVLRSIETVDPGRPQARVEFRRSPATLLSADAPLDRILDLACVAISAEQVGAAQRAFDLTLAYAKQRVQFGRPIGSFQAVKHRLADMFTLLESARSASYAAAFAAVSGQELTVAASRAKAYCSEAFSVIAGEAIQLHGGIGITWEHPIHLYFKRAHATSQLFGTPAWHRRRYAHAVGLAA
ncbi:acyl-CoA dehydrogenase family protein [Catenulispora pinisilvae]|uniref:acyl-CoA dehydrogenase family protein n=1 Tax=Catenulispora pinisilvae TaxID=2705253 RepID=UPI001E397526|nr:acyl-CoA dehydrogenase family protein [Catenulispora pinisilvae]